MIHPWSDPYFRRIGARPACVGIHKHRRIGLWSIHDQVLVFGALEHDPPVLRWTSLPLQRMNRLVIGHGHHRVAVWSSRNDPLVGVGLLNNLAVTHYWPLPHQMNSGSDGCMLHQRQVVWWWWQNNQWPVHLMVTELHPVFTMYLLIHLGLNNLLNTHHTDIIITHHSSCPKQRVLVIITMDTNITTVSTDELTQAVHR
jgi:hypothetical protein